MAYDLVAASSQYINSNASFASVGCPITMACWVRPDLANTGTRPMSMKRTTLTSCLELTTNTSNQFGCNFNYGTSNGTSLYTTSTYSTGTWYHIAGVFTSDTDRLVYVDGDPGTQNTATVQTGAHTFQRPIIGCRNRLSTFDIFFDGRIMEAAVWDAALTAVEILSLSKGYRPSMVRPQNLLYYAPLVADTNDIMASDAETVNGSPTVVAHHRRVG